ncbi:hypothetical protein BDV96DRAFT_578174 [Lophiotrema nucula]|uniref:Uncharacterized protein n=1 Tax=Lophiotrema nucula TaxID=690887 RepID=A0A6A5Z5H3_9PLEO|nr:hypothetical protein BDV96DRAFT_578174 [Lophiotrema nucula]
MCHAIVVQATALAPNSSAVMNDTDSAFKPSNNAGRYFSAESFQSVDPDIVDEWRRNWTEALFDLSEALGHFNAAISTLNKPLMSREAYAGFCKRLQQLEDVIDKASGTLQSSPYLQLELDITRAPKSVTATSTWDILGRCQHKSEHSAAQTRVDETSTSTSSCPCTVAVLTQCSSLSRSMSSRRHREADISRCSHRLLITAHIQMETSEEERVRCKDSTKNPETLKYGWTCHRYSDVLVTVQS